MVPSQVGILTTGTDSVTFKDGATIIGITSLSSGVATYNTSGLSVGSHTITAVFAGDANFLTSTSTTVTITVGQSTPVITWANPAPISYGTLLWTPQLNAVATVGGTVVPGTYTYTPAPGTILATGSHTLSVLFTPNNPGAYTSASATATIQVNQATPTITWPTPDPITYGTPLNVVQLNATATQTTTVSLSGLYNAYGLYTNGSTFSTGGFDNSGSAYSSNSLGTSVTWNGATYPLGPTNAPDAIYGTGTNPIPLPAGYYASLNLLGAMVNNVSPNYTFTVTYTDGTTTSKVINLSDWVYSLNWPGESSIKCNVARNLSTGATQGFSTCVYGYQIALDSTKIVQSVTLPNTRNIVMLAMGLTSPPVAGTFVYNPASGTTSDRRQCHALHDLHPHRHDQLHHGNCDGAAGRQSSNHSNVLGYPSTHYVRNPVECNAT